jgi:hypothetical protein
MDGMTLGGAKSGCSTGKAHEVLPLVGELNLLGSLGATEIQLNSSLLDLGSFDSLFARSGWFSAYFATRYVR